MPKSPQQMYSPEVQNDEMRYQTPVIERKPLSQNRNFEQNGTKVQSSHPGQLYISPTNLQEQKRIVTPPSPPERCSNAPQLQTPPLREAPRPWQTKKYQQEEMPPWTKKENEAGSGSDQVRTKLQEKIEKLIFFCELFPRFHRQNTATCLITKLRQNIL